MAGYLMPDSCPVPVGDRALAMTSIAALREFGLRIGAVGLQISATLAVLRLLPPAVAGIYFKGFVIAYGLAALLRGKYDLFVAQHFAGSGDPIGLSRELVRGIGIRILIRSAIASGILLVVTADLDVMDVYVRPYLETYLPFVLAVPFASLTLYLANVLRAVNRTLSSSIVATFSINIILLIVAYGAAGPQHTSLTLLSWAFFAGCVFSCGVGVLITSRVFPIPPQKVPIVWPEVFEASSRNGLPGIALACLQWGPLCLLALLGTEMETAHYAVATRTATVIEFLVPAVILAPHSIPMPRSELIRSLLITSFWTSISVIAIASATPWITDLYGSDYKDLTAVFMILFATQWINGIGRPAIRYLAAQWDFLAIRRMLLVSMIVALLASFVGVLTYAALGAAVGVCLGAIFLNGQAIWASFAGPSRH